MDGVVHYCVGNMPGAVPYLKQVFPSLAEEKKAKAVLLAWIEQKRKGR